MSGVVVMAYVLAIGFLIVAWGLTTHKHPDRQDGQRKPSASRGTTLDHPCSTQGCDREGAKAIHGWWLCLRCHQEIAARPPFDREAADDFTQWEQEVEA